MTQNETANWLVERATTVLGADPTMGDLEKTVNEVSLESRRIALEILVRRRAQQSSFDCPACSGLLNVVSHARERTVETSFGRISFARSYGVCPACQAHFYPADVDLGLQERARSSPRIQEICALTALRAPAGQAEEDAYRLTGINLTASTIHREARRQGQRALDLRKEDEDLTRSSEGILKLAARAPRLPTHSTLVIEIDAWHIRERDNWGKTEAIIKAGKDVERWHWVYTGTVFRLDQRGTTQSGRPVIADRGYVATRTGIDGFKTQLYAEALQRGLLAAETVLVLADGAVWIWNLADDRFKGATQRVDLYHVQENLWNLTNELHGQGTPEAKQWVRPYLQWLKNRKDGGLDVISSLDQLRKNIKCFTKKEREDGLL